MNAAVNRQVTEPVRVELGTHRLTYLPDGHVQLDPRAWFPGSPAAFWADHAGHLDEEGYLRASVGALLVEYEDRAMLVDTGFGPARIPADHTIPPLGRIEGGGLPDALAAAGRSWESVDTVAFTHLHDDHVGWAGQEGLRTARFAASAEEWRGAHRLPAGQRIALRDGQEVFPGVTALATPGHTRGHLSYLIGGGPDGPDALVVGDVLHSALQLADLDWRAASDTDPAEAARSRRKVVAELSRPGVTGFAGHFSGAVFGRLDASGGRPRWHPIG
ncbi:MBL fold metallo-hydrolase [Streptomyces sp. H28]|uniref:MBL fold metallo-hydrolase n=1 Tax=Streptomyces sp. H28 TaxID=2775865 RepID=UPI0017802FED|nr:MBL fold metallo-hydrolase [Streptomyces sp. H28]MBD9734302.1 MBL fold metallo-hydrolase [Streptomyces sp. H28]